MITYILEFTVFLSLFWAIYELFLKNETFFSYNRLYLLFTPILAAVLPFLEISFFKESMVEINAFQQLPAIFLGEQSPETMNRMSSELINSTGHFGWLLFFEVVYVIGAALILVLALLKVYRLHQLKKSAVRTSDKNLPVWEVPKSKIACTFFNQIFLGANISEDEKEQILLHEKVHLEQKHTYDLVFFELLKIVFWFNPLIYCYQSLLRSLHEYIADREAAIKTSKTIYYERLLNVAFDTQKIAFINQFFNQSLIKKRILMLQQAKSKQTAKLKYLFLIPLILGMMMYVSCNQDEGTNDSSTENPISQKELNDTADTKVLHVQDLNNMTDEENKKMMELAHEIADSETLHKLVLTDGDSKKEVDFDKANGQNKNSVPFTVIDEVPTYPGCENIDTNEASKQCTSDHVTEFLTENFNSEGLSANLKKGENRVYVRFTIDKTGNVIDVAARAASPELATEGKRVVKALPKFSPGIQDGKPADVLYSLPIIFRVKE